MSKLLIVLCTMADFRELSFDMHFEAIETVLRERMNYLFTLSFFYLVCIFQLDRIIFRNFILMICVMYLLGRTHQESSGKSEKLLTLVFIVT